MNSYGALLNPTLFRSMDGKRIRTLTETGDSVSNRSRNSQTRAEAGQLNPSGLRGHYPQHGTVQHPGISDGVLENGAKWQRSVRASDKLATHALGG